MRIRLNLSNSPLCREVLSPACRIFPTLEIRWSLFLQPFALFLQFRALFSFGKK